MRSNIGNKSKIKIKNENMPTAIIAKTVKGKGIKFMENNNDCIM